MIRFKALIVAFALVFAMLAPITIQANTQQAVAANGCKSKMRMLGDKYLEATRYPVPGTMFRAWVDIRMSMVVGYWYCPNGDLPAKIRAKWIDWCYTQPDRKDFLYFQGMAFSGLIWNSEGYSVNPGVAGVNERGVQNCVTQDIPAYKETWMRMATKPRYKAMWKVRIGAATPDREGMFRNVSGGTTNYIKPSDSILIRNWF